MDVAERELEEAWKTFLEDLVERGMTGVELAIVFGNLKAPQFGVQ